MKYQIKTILSDGIAIGNIKMKNFNKSNLIVENEEESFLNALTKSLAQIDKMIVDNQELSDYLIALKLMISDQTLKKDILDLIYKGSKAYEAIDIAIDKHINELNSSTSIYLKERVADLNDIKERILNNLGENKINDFDKSYIICVSELNPTDLIFYKKDILAIVAKKGGYTSHSAILARSWGIPYIISDIDFNDGENIIIDTFKNLIIKEPNQKQIYDYKLEIAKKNSFKNIAIDHDGYEFLANVSSNIDLKNVINYGFDGIGLYRTELIFMNSDKPLSFNEQYKIYSEAVNKLREKPITFRTFDVGDDKKLKYLNTDKKGIDNYINNKELFITQIKALCKANDGNLKIMFPMIKRASEFNFLKEWVISIAKEDNYLIPKIGMMLETKEALDYILEFKDVDFISIGTNDLTKEIYHINREDALDLYDNYIKDLLTKLKNIVDFCKENNIYLSVCGELAAIPKAAIKFYEIGIKNLSVSPAMIKTLNLIYTDYKNEEKN